MADKKSQTMRDDMSNPAGWGYGTNVPAPSHTECDLLILDVMPTESHTSIAKIEDQIRNLSIPGVRWGQKFDVEEVAFGVKKLRCQAIIDNMAQETQTIQDAITRCNGVKSCEFVAFTKA